MTPQEEHQAQLLGTIVGSALSSYRPPPSDFRLFGSYLGQAAVRVAVVFGVVFGVGFILACL